MEAIGSSLGHGERRALLSRAGGHGGHLGKGSEHGFLSAQALFSDDVYIS